MSKVQIPKGLFDITPRIPDEKEKWKTSYLWQWVEAVIRDVANVYGFEELRTPVFERTEVFARGVGATSDIVSKEMYTFDDKAGRSMTLRPEGTAAAMRAFIENKMQDQCTVNKLFYLAPMFRYERPQAGRYRQHHQFGVEAIGSGLPDQDVEVIDLLLTVLRRLGVQETTVAINSLGDVESRKKYRSALQDFFRPNFEELSADSKARFESNPLRILDSKDPKDNVFCINAPSILDFLSSEAEQHFQEVQGLLKDLGIPFTVDPSLVRGLDYYNRTVFEVISNSLGAKNSVAGGGRYDGLIRSLGGPEVPAFGFGCGIERLLQTALQVSDCIPEESRPLAVLIPLGDDARHHCMRLVKSLRMQGITIQMEMTGKKLKHAMRYADAVKAQYTIVIGSDEISQGLVDLRQMDSGQVKKNISLVDLGSTLLEIANERLVEFE